MDMKTEQKWAVQLKAIGDPTRFKILCLLTQRQHCPRSLALTLDMTESAISQHMSVLKKLGLVTSYRHDNHIHYRLEPDALQQLADVLQTAADEARTSPDCKAAGTCEYKIGDSSTGCLYQTPSLR